MEKLELAAKVLQYAQIPELLHDSHERAQNQTQPMQWRLQTPLPVTGEHGLRYTVSRTEQESSDRTHGFHPNFENGRGLGRIDARSRVPEVRELNIAGTNNGSQLPNSVTPLGSLPGLSWSPPKEPPEETLIYPCICGRCSSGECEAWLNLVRWLARRHVSENQQPALESWRRDSRHSSIADDEEASGLAFVESTLPFSQSSVEASSTCLVCQGAGSFVATFNTPVEPSTREIPLYLIKGAARSCTFCEMVYKAIAELVQPSPLYCFRSSRYQAKLIAVNCIFQFANTIHTTPQVLGNSKDPFGENIVRIMFTEPPLNLQLQHKDSLILHSIALSSAAEGFTTGRLVQSTQIKLSLLKEWLAKCSAFHGPSCNGYHLPNADGKLRSLRMVDVVDYCIVRQPSSSRYIALSYVWGRAEITQLTRKNLAEFSIPGALQNDSLKLPQTFLDAFHVVRHMGERYLWVDALCIIQDAEDKEAHLQDMHLVYGAALLTIIAGYGDDANAGLPGIRPSSRSVTQTHTELPLHPGIGVTVSMPLPANLKTSRWFSRAWTYQEQLLSRRFLVFFDDQVIWQCPSIVECEDTLVSNKIGVYERLQHLTSSRAYDDISKGREVPFGFVRPHPFQRYADVVAEYTGRQLTFPEDILQAFSGMSKIFMLDLNSEMAEGLPLSFLDAALLWQPRHPLNRRTAKESFASWSWAGWEGKVAYDNTSVRNSIEAVLPIVKWEVHRSELANRFGIGIKPYLLNPGVEKATWKPPFEPLSGTVSARNTAQLRFWTSCSFFSNLVRRPVLNDTPRAYSGHDANLIALTRLMPQQFRIQNEQGQPIGILTLTGTDNLDLNPLRHEYIVLSEAQFAGIDLITGQPKFLGELRKCLMYNVLLVEWNREKTCAYRVGLGRIMKNALMQTRPCSKYVTLG